MTKLHSTSALCPHLAAAALWMSKKSATTRRGKPRNYIQVNPVPDNLAAL